MNRLNNVYLAEKYKIAICKREKDQEIKWLSKYLCVCKIGHDFDILF